MDRYPLAIVRCADVADVIACVAYARDNVLPLAIRGGGHHGGGFAVWDDALVIDLGGLREHIGRPGGRYRSESTAVVSGAMLIMPPERSEWRCPRASCPLPGVGGLTLGGGIGYLTRRFGLTHRQSCVGRCGAGRRSLCHRERRLAQ